MERRKHSTFSPREAVLYGDDGGHHMVSRFHLVSLESGARSSTVVFHWSPEGQDPRRLD